jgi:hypothetical protein
VLAGRIRGFVKAMPPIDTERHVMKQQLAERFTRRVDHEQTYGANVGLSTPPPTPTTGDKDLER